MTKFTKLLSITLISVLSVVGYAYADGITLHWNSPVTNEDATPLVDLDSFNVYARIDTNFIKGVDIVTNLSQGVVSNPVAGQEYTVALDLPEGTWLTVTAVDKSGNESIFAGSVQYVDGASLDIPEAPGTLYITKP